MKKLSFLFPVAALLLNACGPKQTVTVEDIAEEMATLCKLDVESLNKDIDLDQDIKVYSLSDLRILRNAFAARQGYPFRDSYLRSIFETTTWYDSLMWKFDETSENFKEIDDENLSWRISYYNRIKDDAIKYTPEELAFIERIKERENELLKLNFAVEEGLRVNLANLMNPAQLEDMDPQLGMMLAKNGFAIVPAQNEQLFTVYEKNDYQEFPSFVTCDLFLQLYHLYFDALLRDVEENCFLRLIGDFCHEARQAVAATMADNELKGWLDTYFAVAIGLLNEVEPVNDETARHEYQQVMKSENSISNYLGYYDVPFEYSLFRPRGHYTRNDNLKRYFRTMMWLQTVPFQTTKEDDMRKAALLSQVVGTNNKLTRIYKTLNEPLTWLMGQPDDVSIEEMWELQKNETDLKKLCEKVNELANRKTRIRPKYARTSPNKVRLMPQRYQPDAEVLQEMVDYDSDVSQRPVPRGLDIFAAMGITAAERILIDELNEAKNWKQYSPMLKTMKERMDSIDWQENVANQWIDALRTVADKAVDKAPYFMQTPEWSRKSLNAALASWAELKHDAILYAKQPMGAECGGGGLPDPVVKGYVEPCLPFWRKAAELIDQTAKLFKTYQLMTPRGESVTERIDETVAFLLKISEKELQGNVLSDEEYDQLKYIGATYENISLELLREPNQDMWEWANVEGTDRKIALIADVYTANADNNPNKAILFEGVGLADEIYVVVPVDGRLYLMRGAVFSYRELTRPYGEQRLNDEEWQKMIEEEPRLGVPEWMTPIIVPIEPPTANETVFYSSGC